VARKGRPPKDTSVSDTDSAPSSKGSNKGPGRPKKSAKVVKSETSDDLIAALVAEATPVAEKEAVEEVKETVQTDSKAPTKTEITKANLASLKEMCAAAGLEDGKKGEMQAALRTHFGYDSDSDSSKKEKKTVQKKKPVQKEEEPVAEPVEEAKEEAVEEEAVEAVSETISELSAEESAGEEEEEEEEGVTTEDFKFEGKTYKRVTSKGDHFNLIVDEEGTQLGKWTTDGPEWDEDEEEEDED